MSSSFVDLISNLSPQEAAADFALRLKDIMDRLPSERKELERFMYTRYEGLRWDKDYESKSRLAYQTLLGMANGKITVSQPALHDHLLAVEKQCQGFIYNGRDGRDRGSRSSDVMKDMLLPAIQTLIENVIESGLVAEYQPLTAPSRGRG